MSIDGSAFTEKGSRRLVDGTVICTFSEYLALHRAILRSLVASLVAGEFHFTVTRPRHCWFAHSVDKWTRLMDARFFR